MTPKTIYELGASPINNQAKKELLPQEQYVPAIKATKVLEWESCPPLAVVPDNIRNFTGVVKGRLTAVGYSHKGSGSGSVSHKWICRCNCGRYCVRSAKWLDEEKENPDHPDFCTNCHHLWRLQKTDRARQLGHYPDGTPFKDD